MCSSVAVITLLFIPCRRHSTRAKVVVIGAWSAADADALLVKAQKQKFFTVTYVTE